MALEKKLSKELKIVFTDCWIYLVAKDGEEMPITPHELDELKKILKDFDISEYKPVENNRK